MVLGLSLRVSWICLLLFSSGACFPSAKGDYRYPYTAIWGSGGGPAPGSNLQSGSSHPALVSVQHEPSANQQPEAASSPSYEPNRFIVSYDSSSNKPSIAPEVPSQSAGYVSPPVGPLPPAGTGKKTPSFSVQPQAVASSSGNSNMGSFYGASPFPPSGFAYPAETAGNMATTYGFGDGPVPYAQAPATYGFGDGPVPYGNPSSAGSLPWATQPVGGAYASYDPSNWMPSQPFPDLSAWGSNNEMQQSASETSPLPPSSYIIQSRNGYQQAREVLSHTKYSPEYPEPPVFPSNAVKAPRRSPPVTGSKGGKQV